MYTSPPKPRRSNPQHVYRIHSNGSSLVCRKRNNENPHNDRSRRCEGTTRPSARPHHPSFAHNRPRNGKRDTKPRSSRLASRSSASRDRLPNNTRNPVAAAKPAAAAPTTCAAAGPQSPHDVERSSGKPEFSLKKRLTDAFTRRLHDETKTRLCRDAVLLQLCPTSRIRHNPTPYNAPGA